VNTTCLIGEDSPAVIHLLRTYALMVGLTPAIATVGERVLELARETEPAVIVLNAELPGRLRGWDALQTLKADAVMHHIPVVAFWLDPELACHHGACDADASMSMPMNFAAFRSAVEAACGKDH
jgi:DNA-binding response OmpR family regulator